MGEKVIDIIRHSNKTLCSFELLPPLRGDDIESIDASLDPLMEFISHRILTLPIIRKK